MNVEIIGWDDGYNFNKTSEGIIYPSKLLTAEQSIELNTEDIDVLFNNKHYIVGRGTYETDKIKFDKERSKVFMLTSLALSSSPDQIAFNVVTGLPMEQYKPHKDEMKDFLLRDKVNHISINGVERTIIVEDLMVYPQCLGAYNSLDEDYLESFQDMDIILVDLGSRTYNVALLSLCENGSRKVEKYNTIFSGTINLYSDLITSINSKFEIDLKIEDAQKILKRGLYIYGKKQSLSFTKEIIEKHTTEIFKTLDLNYPVITEQILLSGGGSYLFDSLFKQKYSHSEIIEDAQFANANGFKEVGCKKWLK